MKRTAIYCRVSTQRQAQEGDSIPAQKEALHKYIDERKDLVFVGEYIDDGVSGTKYDRDELQRLLDDVKAGNIDIILFCKLDRWFRSIKHFLNVQDILTQHNCNWLAIWEPAYDSSTPQGRMVINTMMNMAQFEAENTGQRIRQVFDYKTRKGEALSGKCPLGYRIVDKKLVLSEDAEKIRSVFEHYVKTNNIYNTRDYAASIGFHLEPSSLRYMLRNTTYIGVHRDNNNFCQPLISTELFNEVQRLLNMNIRNNTAPNRVYIFSGLIRCKECGHAFTGVTQKGCYYGYRCSVNKMGKSSVNPCRNNVTYSEKKLEQLLLSMIKPELEKYVLEIKASKQQNNADDIMRKIKNLNSKMERLKDLYIDGEIDKDEYTRKKGGFLSQLIQLQATLKNTDTSKYDKITSLDFSTFYPGLDNERKRMFWRSIIKEIQVSKERNIKIIFL